MAEAGDAGERVVLGRRDDSTWVGFQWSGAEPAGLSEPDEAEALGAVWEGEELVPYDMPALSREWQHAGENFLPDVD